MSIVSSAAFVQRHKVLLPIAVGGGVAGTLDLISAFLSMGWGVPRGIAGGLLGPNAHQGGVAVWILGVFLHFFIAYSAAAIYCISSWKLEFLKNHFLVCGLLYGMIVFLVMTLVVLPLSAYHATGPYQLHSLIHGIGMQMLIIGLPISISLRHFSK